MSLGQHFIVGVKSTRLLPAEREMLKRWKPAGVMLYRKNFHINTGYKQWSSELRDLVADIRDCVGREQLVLATDFEGGRVSHLPPPINDFPFAMKFTSLSADVAKAQAEILKSLGFNFSFAPVADIHSNPANPVIGPRAFGTSAEEVIQYVVPYMQALHQAGVLPCGKHFPGHGDTKTDSHLHLPFLDHDLEFLRHRELLPFKALIDAGTPALMTCHVVFKKIDAGVPATMSKIILKDLLRGELGYKKALLSDCLSGMRAIFDNFSIKTVLKHFFAASGDIAVMWQRDAVRLEDYFEALDQLAQESEEISDALTLSEVRVAELLSQVKNYPIKELPSEALAANDLLIEKVNRKVEPIFLQEAEYIKTFCPSEEPNVRVGVVLLEDQIKREEITFPQDGEMMGVDGECFAIKAGTTIEINATVDGLDIYTLTPQRQQLVYIPNKVILRTKEPIKFLPQQGFLVSEVVAGRIFHWRKVIPQYFTGKLEVYSQRGHLLIVNELPFEDYLSAVATSEMSADCPIDTLKAQVLAARAYTLAYMHGKHRGEPFSVCNDDDCQRYQGTTHVQEHMHRAILETRGEVIVQNNLVVRAHYSKCCGGVVDAPEDIWEISVPGLKGGIFDGEAGSKVETLNLSDETGYREFLDLPQPAVGDVFCTVQNLPPKELKRYLGTVDEQGEYFRWSYRLSAEQLLSNLRDRFKVDEAKAVHGIKIVPSKKTGVLRTRSGRVMAIEILYSNATGRQFSFHVPREYNIRRALHSSFLFSSAFIFENHFAPDGRLSHIQFKGSGWGHGAGYCQIGALGMGLRGYDYKAIIKHYFPGAEIRKCYT
jgi:SpoIID/LytB domain protein